VMHPGSAFIAFIAYFLAADGLSAVARTLPGWPSW
jgi:hypothetical protein